MSSGDVIRCGLKGAIAASHHLGRDHGCFGRFVEGDAAGPFREIWPPLRPPRIASGPKPGVLEDEASEDLAVRSVSLAAAMALEIASGVRSERWLGGLRFEMAGDSMKRINNPTVSWDHYSCFIRQHDMQV